LHETAYLSPEGVGDGASNQTAQDQIRMAATTKIHWIRSLLCSKITVGVARNWGRAFFNLTATHQVQHISQPLKLETE